MASARLRSTFGNYNRDERKSNKLFNYNGVPTKKLFPHAKREGMMSILDRSIKRGDEGKRNLALGEGAVSVKFYDEDGNSIDGDDATLNIDGMNFTADSSGKFRMVDEKWLDSKAEIEFKRRDYIADITYKMVTDEIFAKTLNMSLENFYKLSRNGDQLGDLQEYISKDIASVDCTPSMVDSYVEDSAIWATALAKQRFLVGYFMPILNRKSGTGKLSAKDAISNGEGGVAEEEE